MEWSIDCVGLLRSGGGMEWNREEWNGEMS